MNVRGAVALVALAAVGCPAPEPGPMPDAAAPTTRAEPIAWAIAVHGGAGTIPRDIPDERRDGYLDSLRAALDLGRDRLEAGGSALDVVEGVVRALEDDPAFNAGRGAVFTWDGGHALDASIMDGRDARCGAVAGVTTVRHPITLARRVMDRSPHVLLAGEGAEAFAEREGLELVDPTWFDTEYRRGQWRQFRARAEAESEHGTVGVVVRDRAGDLAAGTSTGGLTGKRWGRVGDTPIVGAGTWADNATCAISSTGKGEEFIRRAVARAIAARVEWTGATCATAAAAVIGEVLAPGDGGVVVVDASGHASFAFNTAGMLRGAADASGRFEVAIWE